MKLLSWLTANFPKGLYPHPGESAMHQQTQFVPQNRCDRRGFLNAAALAAGILPAGNIIRAAPTMHSGAEEAAARLFRTLSPEQARTIAFAWDHREKERGLLRTFVSNNWQVTPAHIRSDFFTPAQQTLAREVFERLVAPQWLPRFLQQLKDDTEGRPWGEELSLAFFGDPQKQFQIVLTGRHLTLRADGNSLPKAAFGGPIFYGHAGQGFNEKADHPGNVFWPQALVANKLFPLLSKEQQQEALVDKAPPEAEVGFRKEKASIPGLPVAEMTEAQKEHLGLILDTLVEPFRSEDQDKVRACLKARGGLDACRVVFYKSGDIGNDRVWDNWRLEGPAFVWHFRGSPHVHVWVHISEDTNDELNARG
jgi:hypothetical protein